MAGYRTWLGYLGFDRAHAATPQTLSVGTFRAPMQFPRVSGAEVLSQSEFEIPLSRAAANLAMPVETAPQAGVAAYTLWG